MANEQIVAELQALKAEPGFQMRWQETIQHAIDAFNAPPPVVTPPPPPPAPPAEEAPKAKVTTAAAVAPPKMKGK